MKLSKKGWLLLFMLSNFYIFGFESNEIFEIKPTESVVFKDGVPLIQDEWGALFSYPEILFTHQGVYRTHSREKNVIYICANGNCGNVYQNQKPVRCGRCGGDKFIVRYQ